MSQRNVLILERSSQNLQKINDKGKVVLEGVLAEFGIENRNGSIAGNRPSRKNRRAMARYMKMSSD